MRCHDCGDFPDYHSITNPIGGAARILSLCYELGECLDELSHLQEVIESNATLLDQEKFNQ